jgi:hypothetical protein
MWGYSNRCLGVLLSIYLAEEEAPTSIRLHMCLCNDVGSGFPLPTPSVPCEVAFPDSCPLLSLG